MSWQPIETAPKDELILATDGRGHWVVRWSAELRLAHSFDATGLKYWMPLPEPPK